MDPLDGWMHALAQVDTSECVPALLSAVERCQLFSERPAQAPLGDAAVVLLTKQSDRPCRPVPSVASARLDRWACWSGGHGSIRCVALSHHSRSCCCRCCWCWWPHSTPPNHSVSLWPSGHTQQSASTALSFLPAPRCSSPICVRTFNTSVAPCRAGQAAPFPIVHR